MSILERIVDNFLEELNISRETVDKVKSIIEQIDITNTDDGVEIDIKLKRVQIKINK